MRKKVNQQQSSSLNKPFVKKVELKNQPSAFSSPYYFLAAILVLVFCIYSNSLRNGILTFDDNEYFTKYPEVLHLSWKSICTYFTHYYVIMYQPLPVLSFALHYYFSAFNTFPIHLVNLLFHLANVLLVYRFIKLLTRNQTTAILIALLFGIHPMNVEAISWISEIGRAHV